MFGILYGGFVRRVVIWDYFTVLMLDGLVEWFVFGIIYGGFDRRVVILDYLL